MKVCHRFTAALMTGRAVTTLGIEPFTNADVAGLSVPCIGSRCALWVRDPSAPKEGWCADNTGRCYPWPDAALAEPG